MKKVLLFFILFFAFACIGMRENVHAKTSKVSVALTLYQTREDIDFLFANSTRVLEYLEGTDVESPTFISLITDEQKNKLIEKGFSPQIVGDGGDLTQYVLLWHPQPNQSHQLKDLGEIFEIPTHYTLVKYPPGPYKPRSGAAAAFYDIPFSEKVVTPPLKQKTTVPDITSAPEQTGTTPSSPPPPSNNNFVVVLILVILAIGVMIALILIKKKQRKNTKLETPIENSPKT